MLSAGSCWLATASSIRSLYTSLPAAIVTVEFPEKVTAVLLLTAPPVPVIPTRTGPRVIAAAPNTLDSLILTADPPTLVRAMNRQVKSDFAAVVAVRMDADQVACTAVSAT